MNRLLLTAATMLLAGGIAAQADEATRYFEGFENATLSKGSGISTNNQVKIAGWGQIVDTFDYQESYWGDYYDETIGADYSINNSGNTGKALACAMQTGSTGGTPSTFTIYDYIVSPLVSGNVDFKIKLSTYKGSIEVKKATLNAATGKYEAGEDIAYEGEAATAAWNTISFNLAEPTMVAIRLNNAIIDDFYADTADVPEVRSMTLEKVSFYAPDAEEANRYPSSDPKIIMNTDNKGTVGARIKVTNTGNVALTPGTENYSVTLKIASSATATGNNVYSTVVVPLDFTLQPGETKEDVDVSCEFTTTQTRPNLSVYENFSNTFTNVGYFTVVPYIATLTIKDEGSSYGISSKDLGIYSGEKQFNLQFQNTGGAPLVITGTDNDNVTFVDELPITVPPAETSLLALKSSGFGEEINATVNILSNAIETTGTRKFILKGYEAPADCYFNTFDDENSLDGWVKIDADKNKWALGHESKDTKDASQKLVNSSSTASQIVSPLLALEEGAAYGFMAYGSSSSAKLRVQYSKDRTNWSDIYLIAGSSTSSSTKDDSFDSQSYALKRFIFSIPEAGNYYIRLDGNSCAIDNFFGGTLTEVAHDLAVISATANATKVNYPLTATATFDNYKQTAETDYEAQLRIDGETVATAEPQEIAFGTPVTFNFNYIPHLTGTHQVSVALAFADEYEIESSPIEVEILEELEDFEKQVNDMTSSASYLPLNLSNYASMSDFLIPAERIGIESGADLTSLALLYYNTGADQYVQSDMEVYIANTEDESITEDTATAPALETMTRVYRSANHAAEEEEEDRWDYVFSTNTGMSEYHKLNFRFAEPFKYTGGNLRIFFSHKQKGKSASLNSFTFRTMSGLPNNTQARYKSMYSATSKDINEVAFSNTTSQPVILFNVHKDAATLSGRVYETVTPSNSQLRAESVEIPVANAVLKLADVENPDIWYTATSDDEGNYEMKVFQPSRTYTLAAEASEDFKKYSHDTNISFADEPNVTLHVEMERASGSNVTDVTADTHAYVAVSKGSITVHGATGVVNIFDMTGAHVAIGNPENAITLMPGAYVVTCGDLTAKVIVK